MVIEKKATIVLTNNDIQLLFDLISSIRREELINKFKAEKAETLIKFCNELCEQLEVGEK